MKLRLTGLHLQLLGLILLPFSIILLFVAISGVQVHQDAMRQLVAERDERAARAAAAAVSEQLHHLDLAVRGLANRAAIAASPAKALRDSGFLTDDFDQGLAILNRSGDVVASSIAPESWQHRPVAEILAAAAGDEALFSVPFTEGDGSTVLVAAGTEEQLAVGAFSISKLIQTTLLSTGMGGSGSFAFVTDSSGSLLQNVGNNPGGTELSKHPGVEAALRGEFGSLFRLTGDGEHVVAFSPIQPTKWALVIEEPWQVVTSPTLDLSLVAPLVLVPALLVTLVGLWFGARQVIRPLRLLQEKAESLPTAGDDVLEESVGGIAEIQNLQDTLNRMTNRLRSARRALQDYIGALTQAQEEERQHLARELHDETIQDLIAVDQRIQMIRTDLLEKSTGEADRLEELHSDVNRAIQDVRRLTRALRPIYLEDLGLTPAVEMLADDLKRDQGISVDVEIEGDIRRFDPETELAIYRIVQEALNNISHHAEASSASIQFSFGNGEIRVEIADDGIGFELPPVRASLAPMGHFGLMGMYERAELIGAQLEITSIPQKGSLVRLSLKP